jgi:hypothetical protein
MDLPGFGLVTGQWDLRGRFGDYVGRVPLSGRTVLDVGTASGFLSFEAEKRGAVVTGFDADVVTRYQHVPCKNKPDHSAGFPMMRNGYWLAHSAYRSDVRVIYGDIYQLSQQVPAHDVVLIGQILVHLRDPLEVLRQASLVTKETLIVTEGSFHSDQPVSVFLGSEQNWYSWWHISDELYRRWFALLGFEIISVTQNKFVCTQLADPGEVWTFVAQRKGP